MSFQLGLALGVFLLFFILTFLLRMPMPLGMLAACVFYFLVTGSPVKMAAQQTLKTFYTNYTIIAIPLFIFAGNIMNNGKVTERVFGFAKCFVGHFRGGLAHVNVLASLIFSGTTGSAIADACGLGKMEIESMRAENYDDGFSCAITATSATLGPIFPPSIPLVMYSMLSNTSVGALFMGGLLPAVLLAGSLMIYIAIISKRRNYPRNEKSKAFAILTYSLKALPALLTPIILMVGIYTGIVTTTEAGALAAMYALLVAVFFYRDLKWDGLKKALLDTVVDTGSVALMVGVSTCISYIVARENIAGKIAESILSLTTNKYLFLLIVNIIILLLGMFIDSTAIQLVFVPMLLPVATMIGIDLVHFGLVTTLNMMIGLSTPPFGMLLFVISGISGTPFKTVVSEIWRPLIVMIIVLMIVTYVPDTVLFLPRLLLGYTS